LFKEGKINMSWRMANCLMAIAERFDSQNCANLPAAWTTAHKLVGYDSAAVNAALKNGNINPRTTAKQLLELLEYKKSEPVVSQSNGGRAVTTANPMAAVDAFVASLRLAANAEQIIKRIESVIDQCGLKIVGDKIVKKRVK
jgi:hypothetical protein